MSEGVEHYLRLKLFLQECCKVLRDLFIQKAQNDATTGVRYTTLYAYLSHHEPEIKRLLQRKVLRLRQYNVLFPPGMSITEEDLDITLVSCLLTNIFKGLPEEHWITNIREVRNTLDHHCDITKIDSRQFNKDWQDLETASNNLATRIDPAYANEVSKTVKELKTKTLPTSSPFLDIIKDILSVNTDLREDLKCIKEVKDSTETTNNYLKNVVKVTKRKNEAPCKRIKTVDNRLEKMKERFTRTMASHLPDNYEPPDDYQSMRTALLGSSRRLCLIGSKSSKFLASALHLAKSLDVESDRCVEMTRFSDWEHIDIDDVGLVIYRDPIGSTQFMPGMVKDAHKCFDLILHETQDQSTEYRSYVIITMEKDIFAEYSKYQDTDIHDLFEDHFEYEKTTTGEDVDILSCKANVIKRNTEDPVLTNLQVQTKTYLEFHKRWIPLPETIVDDAANILKRRNMLHIDGPEKTGKTSLAAHLMTPFVGRCILLRNTYDIRHIRIDDGFVILIEDFTGKYKSNESEALKWYGVFDILLPAVRSGKLRVIIVTESTSFKVCRLPPHALLQNCLTLKSTTEAVIHEAEPLTQSDLTDGPLLHDSCPRSLQEASFDGRRSFELSLEGMYDVCVTGCTFLPNGLFVVAYGSSIIVVDQLDELSDYPPLRCIGEDITGIATLSFNEVVVIFQNSCCLQCISVKKHGLKLKEKIDVGDNFRCVSVDVSGGEIFVLCKSHKGGEYRYEVRVLYRNGTIQRSVNLGQHVSLNDSYGDEVKVSRNGNRLYVSTCTYNCDGSVLCFSKQGDLIYKYSNDDLDTPGMIVDDEDNVLVCGKDDSGVHLIDTYGRKQEVTLIKPDEGISQPWYLSYRQSDSCLVLMSPHECAIFDVKW